MKKKTRAKLYITDHTRYGGDVWCCLLWPEKNHILSQYELTTPHYKRKVTAIKRAREMAEKLGLEIVEEK